MAAMGFQAPIINDSANSLRSWMSFLDQLDESISRPMFRLGLPKWIEFVFSIPANLFGTTACLTIGPLWIAIAAIFMSQHQYFESYNERRILLLLYLTSAVTILYVIAWGVFQLRDQRIGQKLFWNSRLYALATPWSVGILAFFVLGLKVDSSDAIDVLSPKEIFSIAIYPLVLWPPVLILMTEGKNLTRRSRPAKKDIERPDSEHWIQRKKFPATSQFLAKYNGDQSFPSGDVAMAVLIAVPLWNIGYKTIAVAITLLSALGRMYTLAHHLSDVISGFLLTLGVHGVAIALGYGMHQVEWWHPFLAAGCYAVLLHFTNTGRNPMEKQGGRKTE